MTCWELSGCLQLISGVVAIFVSKPTVDRSRCSLARRRGPTGSSVVSQSKPFLKLLRSVLITAKSLLTKGAHEDRPWVLCDNEFDLFIRLSLSTSILDTQTRTRSAARVRLLLISMIHAGQHTMFRLPRGQNNSALGRWLWSNDYVVITAVLTQV